MDKETLQKLILETVEELMSRSGGETPGVAGEEPSPAPEEVRDLSAVDFRNIISVPHPCQPELFQEWRAKSTARIGIWRAGPRYRTESYLRFRADHAAAMDAVAKDVPREILEEMGLFQVQTICQSKDEYLTQPDRGRLFSPETMEAIRKNCVAQPDVQLVVADGLSSTAITANVRDILPAILQGLEQRRLRVGTPIFVKYGRVGAMDPITEMVGAKVTVILVGERPGLATSQSMSAYMTYGGYVGMPEAGRTVISNIHAGGTNAVEAGAFVAELCQRMLDEKASGLDLVI